MLDLSTKIEDHSVVKKKLDQFAEQPISADRKRLARKRVDGICSHCTKPAVPGKKSCKKCLKYGRNLQKRLRKNPEWRARQNAYKSKRRKAAYWHWRRAGLSYNEIDARRDQPTRFPINQPVSVEE